MATRKSTKELMAMRNPLLRTSVKPVDIYSQAPEPLAVTPELKQVQPVPADEQPTKQVPERKLRKAPTLKKEATDSEALGPYSTHLTRKSIKHIKFRALERDTKDYRILQEAVDEYFERHPSA